MNNFDAVDFSECHSEEVMFLLTFSVFYAGAPQGNGEPYSITDGDFVVGNTIWGFKITCFCFTCISDARHEHRYFRHWCHRHRL